MNQFLKHESCPSCGSRDNLGVWADGHKWCFGCGYYVPPTGGTAARIKFKLTKESEIVGKAIKMPSDCSLNFPKEAKAWLDRYQIFHQDIVKHQIQWSERARGIVLPINNKEGQPIFYQIRRFDMQPKYLTFGRTELDKQLPIFGVENQDIKNVDTVVVVEDYISAIRVSYVAHCMPLFGSHLNLQTAAALSRKYKNLIIWLDADKYTEAVKFYNQYCYLFEGCVALRTTMDPKQYAHYEITANLSYYIQSFSTAA